jgi:hypothetical protein
MFTVALWATLSVACHATLAVVRWAVEVDGVLGPATAARAHSGGDRTGIAERLECPVNRSIRVPAHSVCLL